MSFGMRSAHPHMLAVLDPVRGAGRPAQCVGWARAAGFEHVSLDLIYGTPGETDADWRRSLETALAAGPDHISAYALIVEEGTRLAARVRRGELPAPDDDAMADRYLIAEKTLTAYGLSWYEVSNWAASGPARCAHNISTGPAATGGRRPGEHRHVGAPGGGTSNTLAYAGRISRRHDPAAHGDPDPAERQLERIMLLTRLSDGCPGT